MYKLPGVTQNTKLYLHKIVNHGEFFKRFPSIVIKPSVFENLIIFKSNVRIVKILDERRETTITGFMNYRKRRLRLAK